MSIEDLVTEINVVAKPYMTISKVLNEMRSFKVWTVPVVNDYDKLVGVVTYRDLLERRVSPKSRIYTVMARPLYVKSSHDFNEVLRKFITCRVKALPVTNDELKVEGMITREKVIEYALKNNILKNYRVSEIMSSNVISISPNEAVARAKWLMLKYGVTRLPIIDDELVGIVSMRDIVEKIYYAGLRRRSRRGEVAGSEIEILAAPIKAVMSYPVITASIDDDLMSVFSKLSKGGISGLPIISNGKVVGIVSTYDMIKKLSDLFKITLPITFKIDVDVDDRIRQMIEKVLSNYLGKIMRMTNVINFEIIIKTYKKASSDKRLKYSIHAKLKDDYANYNVNVVDWDVVKAIRDCLDLLIKNVDKFLSRLEMRRRRVIKG